jgi:hypothetical protein
MKKQLSPEEKLKKAELRAEIKFLLAKGIHGDTSELREFLESVIPHKGMDYYLYIVDEEKTKVNIGFDREEYIDALCCLSQYNYNDLFYHPASFDGWKKMINATSLNCLYVDIDDINFYADENDKESTLKFLKERYNLSEDKLGNYAILSGRGIHLVYKIDPLYFHPKTIEITKGRKKYNIVNSKPCPHLECKNRAICEVSETCINIDIFKRYTNSLIVQFGADFSGEVLNHMYRCPTSYNNKEREIKGKIFKLNDSENTDIHRLDWALKTDEEIKECRKNHYAERGKKGQATHQRNLQKKSDFLQSLGDQTLEEFLERTDISEEDRNYASKLLKKILEEEGKSELNRKKKNALAIKTVNETDYYDDSKALPYKHLRKYTGYKPQNRNWNLLLDLHNFFIAHRGRLVSRNLFFFIISNYLKMMDYSYYYALKYCRKYVDRNYYDEMEATVNATYNNETTYYFTYDYIASALCFSDEDIKNSYCNFSPERRKEAKRLNNQRYYQKKKADTGLSPAKQKKASEVEFIKNNPDIKWQEATEKLGISRSKFFAIRKEIGLSANC